MEAEWHIAERPVGHWRNKGEIQRFLEANENEITAYQNLWDTAKAVLWEVGSYEHLHKKRDLEQMTYRCNSCSYQNKNKPNPKLAGRKKE
jgi:hypothetical protein